MNNEVVLVSVIIPTYNRAKFLPRAIESALSQIYENIEIIIVDDCSPDDTESIVKAYQKKHKNIFYYKNKENAWPCFSRNRGIAQAKWEYINFLDDDDSIRPDKLKKQVELFDRSDDKVEVISCHVAYHRSDITMIKKNTKSWNIFKDLLQSYCVSATHSMLIKKTALEKSQYDPHLPSWQEYDLMLQIAQKWWYFDYVNEVLCDVFESKNQISFNFKKKIQWNLVLIRKRHSEWRKNWTNIAMYNYARFGYLLMKYSIGYVFGKKIYLLLP